MNVSLTPELEQFIQQRVAGGLYTSASEVVREALRLLAERDEVQELHKAALREQISAGMESLRLGRHTDGAAFMATMEAGLADLERRGSA
jgi:antitoxin ParD1/3/4